MKPPVPLQQVLIFLSKVMPQAKLVPQKDLADLAFRESTKKNMVYPLSWTLNFHFQYVQRRASISLKCTNFPVSRLRTTWSVTQTRRGWRLLSSCWTPQSTSNLRLRRWVLSSLKKKMESIFLRTMICEVRIHDRSTLRCWFFTEVLIGWPILVWAGSYTKALRARTRVWRFMKVDFILFWKGNLMMWFWLFLMILFHGLILGQLLDRYFFFLIFFFFWFLINKI